MPSVKKELYLSNNMCDLNKLTILSDTFKSTPAKLLHNSATKLFDEGEKMLCDGDEERAYVIFMKFFNIVQLIKTSGEYRAKKEFFDKCISNVKLKKAIVNAETAAKSLKKRYDFKEAELVAKKLTESDLQQTSRELQKNKLNGHVTLIDESENDAVAETLPTPVKRGGIGPMQMYLLMQDSEGSLLIMDTRSASEYSQSHLRFGDIINVPADIIQIGTTVKHIEKHLPSEAHTLWQNRGKVDYIVLVDWGSHNCDVTPGSCLKTLRDALYKFDNTVVLRSEPLVLEGGYDNWLVHYPSVTTNPDVDRPPTGSVDVPMNQSLDFDYPDLDEGFLDSPPTKQSTTTEPVTKPTTRPTAQPAVQSTTSSFNGIVGTSMPIYPIYDRSKKPAGGSSGSSEGHSNWSTSSGSMANVATSREGSVSSDMKRVSEEQEELDRIKKEKHKTILEHKARSERLKKERREYAAVSELKKKEEEEVERMIKRKMEIEEELREAEGRRKESLDLEKLQEKKERESAILKKRMERKKEEDKKKREEAEVAEKEQEVAEKEQEAAKGRSDEERRKNEQMTKEENELRTEKLRNEKEAHERIQQAEMERKRLDDERREKERAEAEKREMERLEKEKRVEERKEQKERDENERRKHEKRKREQEEAERKKIEEEEKKRVEHERLAKERAERGRREADEKLKKIADAQKSVVAPLPLGWDKILDSNSNRYYYRNHVTRKTQWNPPTSESSTSSGDSESYKTRLKDDSSESSRSLVRSHSSPDISKLVDQPWSGQSSIMPLVNRGSKPSLHQTSSRPTFDEVVAARNRDFNPVFGRSGAALTGLRNLGNTCYMNSTIQCLNNCWPLVCYIRDDLYLTHINRNNSLGYRGEVVDEFAVVIKVLWAGKYKSISSRDFKSSCGRHNSSFASYEQQDSQEFLAFLLDALHEGLNEIKVKPVIKEQNNDNVSDPVAADNAWESYMLLNKSIIVQLFQGQLKSTVECMTCRKQSVTFDTFQYLTLPIPSSSKCTLKDCLRLFLKEEKLSGSSRWRCPRCKTERDAVKKLDIWKLPNILIIHLNRFFFEGMWRQKLNTNVDFPLSDLDLNLHTAGPKKRPVYNLYAVTNHYGTMEGGHYTAYCKHPTSMNWHKFDDTETNDISESSVKSSAVYFLFYTSIPPG